MCVYMCGVCVCVSVCGVCHSVCHSVCVYSVCQYKLLHSNKLSQLSNFVSSLRVHCVTILYNSYETSNINIVMKLLNSIMTDLFSRWMYVLVMLRNVEHNKKCCGSAATRVY